MICTNCKEPIDGNPELFQGIMICKNCKRMVNHQLEKTKKEMNMLLFIYIDMLRVSLSRGEFRFPVISEKPVSTV